MTRQQRPAPMVVKVVRDRSVALEVDADDAQRLLTLAGWGITARRSESAGGWRVDAELDRLLRGLREVIVGSSVVDMAVSVDGSAVDDGRDVLASCLSVTETARLLRVSERRVRQLIVSDELRARRLPEGVWLIDRSSVEARRLERAIGHAM